MANEDQAASQCGTRPGYPAELACAEQTLLGARRRAPEAGKGTDDPRVGVALSGGGIRSATFSLGLFQALAEHDSRLLGRIDYLSTVSGGGYFGGFYGRMFHRVRKGTSASSEDDRASAQQSAQRGESAQESTGAEKPALEHVACNLREEGIGQQSSVLRWLRENGRYLAPNGAGDLLVGVAVLLRNWIAIWVALGSAVLSLLLLLHMIRAAGESMFVKWCAGTEACTVAAHGDPFRWMPTWQTALWGSPYFVLVVLVVLVAVAPLAWSYWLTRMSDDEPWGDVLPRWGVTILWILVAADAAIFADLGLPASDPVFAWDGLAPWVTRAVAASGLVALLATGWTVAAYGGGLTLSVLAVPVWYVFGGKLGGGLAAAGAMGLLLWWRDAGDAHLPRVISKWLAHALVVAGILFAIAAIDTLGQTLYALAKREDGAVIEWFAALGAGFASVFVVARRLLSWTLTPGKRQIKLPMMTVASILGVMAAVFALVGFSIVSHGIAHDFDEPSHGFFTTSVAAEGDAGNPEDAVRASFRTLDPDGKSLYGGLGLMLVVAVVTGASHSFFNRSSHHLLYAARLRRAYLGASNPARLEGSGQQDVTRVHPDDDIDSSQYWPGFWGDHQHAEMHHQATGAPLHLVNVTINETVLGRSNIQQYDRRGLGLALGPCGLSVGVRHHLVKDKQGCKALPTGKDTFCVFASDKPGAKVGPDDFERLSLGHWLAISGAAFTTGLGFRTRLGLSLLLGLANVRLGHWWDTHVQTRRNAFRRISYALDKARIFVSQRYIMSEFFARFPGTAKRLWYLSDGGHFENTGAYELIRRHVEVIVLVDAAADPEYAFADLANLIRKARIDFDTDIRFLPHRVDSSSAMKTALSDLRPSEMDAIQGAGAMSTAHAAVAKIRYPGGQRGWLLYIKPTIVGDEPQDVLEYHKRHPKFPQETTVDQFFDEAQWESYRRLGMHIGEVLLGNLRYEGVRYDADSTLKTMLTCTELTELSRTIASSRNGAGVMDSQRGNDTA